jgi:hypothetical protein
LIQFRCRKSFKKSIRILNSFVFRKCTAENDDKEKLKFYERLEKLRPMIQKQVFSGAQHQVNCGTIIVLTSFTSRRELEKIIECVEEQVQVRNDLYKSSCTGTQTDLSILPITGVKLFIVHIASSEEEEVTRDFKIDCRCACSGMVGLYSWKQEIKNLFRKEELSIR